MRIKIDVWSQGLDESLRNQARENLTDLFCQLPPRRVYFYAKHIRHMLLIKRHGDNKAIGSQDTKELIEGSEDTIAKGESIERIIEPVSHSPAAQVFRRDRLSRLLYFTTMNAVEMAKNPDFSVEKEITLDERGARLLRLV